MEALLEGAVTEGSVVEISGPGGTGKTGLLRAVVESRSTASRILVLAPDRTPAGGWPIMRAQFGILASAEEFLSDLVQRLC